MVAASAHISSVEPPPKSPFPWRVFLTALAICAGGSFHFGYQLVILNPSEWIYREFINQSHQITYGYPLDELSYNFIWSFILNCTLIGGLLGTLPLVWLSETFGRRRSFYVSSIFTIVGLILQSVSRASFKFELLALGRLISGFGIGLSLALEPMYFNEISPRDRRGFVGSMTGIFVEVGFFVGGVMGIPATLGTRERSPYMFAVAIIPVVLLVLVLPFAEESPKWLLSKGRMEECRRVLLYFGRSQSQLEANVKDIQAELDCQKERVELKEIWQKIYLRRATILGVLVAISPAFSGILAINFFSTQIFVNVGFTSEVAQYASLGVFLSCALSAILGGIIVDKAGRRPMLLATTLGLITSNTALVVLTVLYDKYGSEWLGYLGIVACLGVCLAFGCGPAILRWTVTSEMIPQTARSSVQSVAMIAQSFSQILTGMAFFPLQGAVGAYSFLIFAIPLVLLFVVFALRFPETKNKHVTEILRDLGYRDNKVEDKEMAVF